MLLEALEGMVGPAIRPQRKRMRWRRLSVRNLDPKLSKFSENVVMT